MIVWKLSDVYLEVYPNPANDYINVIIPDNSIQTISIIDVTGITVKEEQITSTHVTINTADLPSGIYFIIGKGDDTVYKSRITIK